ncbi:radical SAM protein [Candidatus Pacearchaeota archaeon]|nr:radical SAM protein [Candidatus Pacearchaeota archaeon]
MGKESIPDMDLCKLAYHPERVAEWKQTGDCFPVYVEVGPTNRCNHNCMFCALDWVERGEIRIDKKVLCKNLEDMARSGVESVMFAGEGEPLAHPNAQKFVQEARKNNMEVYLTTNGVLLTRKRVEEIIPYLSWIRFSVDAGTRESYGKIHRTREEDFDRVWRNIGDCVDVGRTSTRGFNVSVQTLLLSENIGEIERLAELCKQNGVSNLQVKPYSHHPDSKNDLSVDLESAQRLGERLKRFEDGTFRVFYRGKSVERLTSEKGYSECLGLPFFALIDASGNVLPCNLFYEKPEFYYGNINHQMFSELWKGDKRKQVLERLRQQGIGGCRDGCRLDPSNRYLSIVKNPGAYYRGL